MMRKFIFLFLLLPFSSVAQDVVTTPVENGVRIDFHSRVLNEKRTIWVRVPASYHEKNVNQSYPVLYALDGKSAFFPLTGVVSFMSEAEHVNHQIPEMIVVGVDTEKRLFPSPSTIVPLVNRISNFFSRGPQETRTRYTSIRDTSHNQFGEFFSTFKELSMLVVRK
ncbi:MAG: alpha/beta hydrolase-fold protein [Bacteroidota bacterium]